MTFTYLCFFLLTLHVSIVTSAEEGGCYEVEKMNKVNCKAPREWISLGVCNGSEQSPINIITKNVEYKKIDSFHFTGYNEENNFVLKNTGHSAELSLEGDKEISISGGGLGATYKALQLHFHWGNTDMFGSEHSIDGERYDGELHIVHQKVTSRSRTASRETGGGNTGSERTLAVLGFFIEKVAEDNIHYASIIEALSKIPENGNSQIVSKVKVQDLIPEEKNLTHFYRYDGSLTTVPCSETVTWTVFPETIKLGNSQMNKFYTTLKYASNITMVENFRPVQKLGRRTVYTSGVDAVLSYRLHLLLSLAVVYLVSTS